MADPTEQITGIIPAVVAGGVAIKMTQSIFGSQTTKGRRGKKGSRKSSASPWSNNPMANGKSKSPW